MMRPANHGTEHSTLVVDVPSYMGVKRVVAEVLVHKMGLQQKGASKEKNHLILWNCRPSCCRLHVVNLEEHTARLRPA